MVQGSTQWTVLGSISERQQVPVVVCQDANGNAGTVSQSGLNKVSCVTSRQLMVEEAERIVLVSPKPGFGAWLANLFG